MHRIVAGILTMSCALFAGAGDGADLARGRALHDQVCTTCHGTGYYTRKDHIVRSLDKLKSQVRGCQEGAGENWTEEQIEDVTAWLNASFYKFK